ncbi:hypothetical protein RB598_007432 [Gaeumannomyces tritici]
MSSKPLGDRPFFGLRGGWLTLWITIACATDMTLFGYDQAVFSGVIVTHDFLALHGLVGQTSMIATLSAIYAVGCFLGAVVAFSAGERLGRKRTVLLGTAVMSAGAALCTASHGLPQMFVGRVVTGVGNGVNTATAPVWQTETSRAAWRGRLVLLEMGMNIVGFCLCNWVNYAMSFAGGSVAWRFPLSFQFVLIAVLFATVPWLPESPRWLAAHGRHAEALQILGALEGRDVDDPSVEALHREIVFSVEYEREHAVRWRDLARGRASAAGNTKTIRRLLLGAGTQLMQQFGGINIASYYMPTVFINAVGLSETLARLLSAVAATVYMFFSLGAVTLVEKWGRRGLMMLSTAGQLVSFLAITILLRFAERGEEDGSGRGPATASIFFFFFYYISFGVGMLGVPWLYPTEINSLPMRTKGAAFATCTNWITNFAIVEITPIGIENIGWRFWIVWTIFNAVFLPVIYFFYPETSNRKLEDMDEYFRSGPRLIVTGDKAAICTARPVHYIEREEEEIRRRARDHGNPSPVGLVEDLPEEKKG